MPVSSRRWRGRSWMRPPSGRGLRPCPPPSLRQPFRDDDPEVAAESREGTRRTPRANRTTDLLAEADEQLVHVEPRFPRNGPHEGLLRRLGRLRADEAESVAYPMHVRIRRDARLAVAVHENAVGRLRTDLWELDELLVRPRHAALMAVGGGLAA